MRLSGGLNGRFAVVCIFIVLVFFGGLAIAFNDGSGGPDGLLPPVPVAKPTSEAPSPTSPPDEDHAQEPVEEEPGATSVPGAASLAGPPASVVRRFARDWANRNTILTPATKREMIGLSAGTLAGAISQRARLTLPPIEGVRAEGDLVMMKLSTVAPRSKTALVLTEERLRSPDGKLTPPRYELYLARVDQVTPDGYAITAWEPQR